MQQMVKGRRPGGIECLQQYLDEHGEEDDHDHGGGEGVLADAQANAEGCARGHADPQPPQSRADAVALGHKVGDEATCRVKDR